MASETGWYFNVAKLLVVMFFVLAGRLHRRRAIIRKGTGGDKVEYYRYVSGVCVRGC